jgi:hypothetical protein
MHDHPRHDTSSCRRRHWRTSKPEAGGWGLEVTHERHRFVARNPAVGSDYADGDASPPSAQRRAARSSVARASTQRSPSPVCSFFQNGARVLR